MSASITLGVSPSLVQLPLNLNRLASLPVGDLLADSEGTRLTGATASFDLAMVTGFFWAEAEGDTASGLLGDWLTAW